MKLFSAIIAGCVLGLVAAASSIMLGHGALFAFGAYVLFGMIGTLAAALINWSGRRPFARRNSEASRKAELAFTRATTARSRS